MTKLLEERSRGQVALIMVLIMTVISALVVSFAGRVTVETRVQNMLSDSTNAFLTARSGIEEAILGNGSDFEGTMNSNKSYEVSKLESGETELVFDSVSPGNFVEVNLLGSSGFNDINVYWSGIDTNPVSIFVSVKSASGFTDYAYDSVGLNGFEKVSSGGTLLGKKYDYLVTLPIGSNIEKMQISVFGGSTSLGIAPNSSGGLLPPQIVKYRSVGRVNGSDRSINYGLEYNESKNNKVPEVFNFALFSFGSIIQ